MSGEGRLNAEQQVAELEAENARLRSLVALLVEELCTQLRGAR